MKKNILFLLSLCLVILSCSKDEEPYLSINQTELTVSDVGGSQSISFESNMSWTAKSSESWCTVSPSNGDASSKSTTVTISENDTYSDRSCTVTISVGSISKSVTINQNSKSGLFVSKDKYELSNESTTIEVEVEANIEYAISISDNWITNVTSRGLSSNKLTFNIAENKSYDKREGAIIISQKDGDLSSTIKILQSQLNAVIISNKIVDLLSNSQTLEVNFDTNIDFDVVIPDDAKNWISHTPTRGLRTENILLDISENDGVDTRSAEVYIKDKESIIKDTLTIYQYEKSVYYVRNMGGLSTILNQTQKDTITTMIVRGEINKADFEVMKSHMPKLRYIDLKDVKCEDDKIPNEAFGDWNNPNKYISRIILPTRLTTIGKRAFYECSGLTGSLNLPEGLIKIEEYAFGSCSGLTGSLNIPTGITSIERAVFNSCTGFTGTLNLPAGLTFIGEAAFYNCYGLNGELKLPAELETIISNAFSNCTGFTGTLNLPAGLRTIENSAFYGCSGFNGSLNFSDGLTKIGERAFNHCYGFKGTLKLPAELKTIDSYAFEGCSGFTGSLNLPAGLTTIGRSAFDGCRSFTGTLKLPVELNSLEARTFYNCSGLTGLAFGNNIGTIYEKAFSGCINISGDVIFPISLSSIRNDGFTGCNKVDAFRFPHITPPPYYADMLPINATVEVPNSAVETYKSTEGWKDYNIVGY